MTIRCPNCQHVYMVGGRPFVKLTRDLMDLNFEGEITQSELMKKFTDTDKVQMGNSVKFLVSKGYWVATHRGVYKINKEKVKENATD